MRRIVYTIAAGLAAFATLATPSSAEGLRAISYALPSKSFSAAAPRIADALGLFAKHGLKANFTYIDTTAATTSALLSRSVEFAETETTSAIAAAARGQHITILAHHYTGLSGTLILSKATVAKLGVSPDAPPAARLKALDKVLLSSPSRISSLTVSYKAAANAAGAEPRFSFMAVNAAGAALEAGAVEGSALTAPFWALPVVKGTAVVWLSPAKGDIDRNMMASTAVATATTRDFAASNPDLVNQVVAVYDDLKRAWADRPKDVHAAYAKVFPELDANTLELILSLEAGALLTKPLTPEDIKDDIAYMKMSGGEFGPLDQVDPAALLLKR